MRSQRVGEIRWRSSGFQPTQTAVGGVAVSSASPRRRGGIKRLGYMTYASAEPVITLPTEAPLQAAAGVASRSATRQSVGEGAGDRVQRSNPLQGIVREFLFEGNVSYVAMGTFIV